MYRFALRPRWLLSHLFALVVVVVFVLLGLWQLRRHDDRADRNTRLAERTEQPTVALGDLLDRSPVDDPVDELRYRPVTVTGTFHPEVFVVDNRSRDGLPGAWVLGTLEAPGLDPIVVIRGFLPTMSGLVEPPGPPDTPVEVTGTIAGFDDRRCGVRTDDAGMLVGMACLRRDAVEGAVERAVAPVVVQVVSSDPPDSPDLSPVPLPAGGSGPHRGYAGQWFIFATIVAVTYPLIVRKVARERAVPSSPEGDPS